MYYDRLAIIYALVQDVTARMDKLRPLYTLISQGSQLIYYHVLYHSFHEGFLPLQAMPCAV